MHYISTIVQLLECGKMYGTLEQDYKTQAQNKTLCRLKNFITNSPRRVKKKNTKIIEKIDKVGPQETRDANKLNKQTR